MLQPFVWFLAITVINPLCALFRGDKDDSFSYFFFNGLLWITNVGFILSLAWLIFEIIKPAVNVMFQTPVI